MSQLHFFSTPLNTTSSPQRREVVDLVTEFCREIERVTNGRVTCVLISGFTTNLGREFRATAQSPQRKLDHILFRVHVPLGGLPTYFDFYEDEMVRCDSVVAVREALVGFAQAEPTRETLRLLSQ